MRDRLCILASVTALFALTGSAVFSSGQVIIRRPPAAPGITCSATAASTSYANVNTVVQAASDGDVICIPAGSSAWGANTLTVGTKSITIKGVAAGTEAECGIGGQTTKTCITGTQSPILSWQTKSTGLPRITGITFETEGTMGGCSTYGSGLINISGVSANFRFDHNVVITRDCTGVIIAGYVRGVVDQNAFELRVQDSHVLIVEHQTWQGTGVAGYCSATDGSNCGDKSWSTASTIGTLDAVYVEDNTFSQTLGVLNWGVDDNVGGRSVYRFNTFNDLVLTNHGTESGGRVRGLRQQEAYRNRHVWTLSLTPSMIATRGGTGMVFDNVATGSMDTVFDLQNQRTDTSKNYEPFCGCGRYNVTITRSGSIATGTHDGPAFFMPTTTGDRCYVRISGADQSEYNGVFVATGSGGGQTFTFPVSGTPATPATGTIKAMGAVDGNTATGGSGAADGYRCLDQPGAGQTDTLTGYGPDFDPLSPQDNLHSALEPYYIWNNTDDGVLSQPINKTTSVQVILRDYYQQNNSFNGTTQHGIGRGTRASRPSSCQIGDAWWATDGGGNWNTSTTEIYSSSPGLDGGLDKCTGTNSWTDNWYVPPTYPHPLRAGS
jgi:hypothetical protein